MQLKKQKELEKKASQFFLDCDEKEKPYTISGLATALGFSRLELIELAEAKKIKTLLDAVGQCETFAEERLLNGKNLTGVMFSLKNNFGWREKVELGERNIEIIVSQPKKEEE